MIDRLQMLPTGDLTRNISLMQKAILGCDAPLLCRHSTVCSFSRLNLSSVLTSSSHPRAQTPIQVLLSLPTLISPVLSPRLGPFGSLPLFR